MDVITIHRMVTNSVGFAWLLSWWWLLFYEKVGGGSGGVS